MLSTYISKCASMVAYIQYKYIDFKILNYPSITIHLGCLGRSSKIFLILRIIGNKIILQYYFIIIQLQFDMISTQKLGQIHFHKKNNYLHLTKLVIKYSKQSEKCCNIIRHKSKHIFIDLPNISVPAPDQEKTKQALPLILKHCKAIKRKKGK